jgi:chaperonin GroES
MQVKPGDHVLFGKYSGDEFEFGEDEWLLIRESDILAVID